MTLGTCRYNALVRLDYAGGGSRLAVRSKMLSGFYWIRPLSGNRKASPLWAASPGQINSCSKHTQISKRSQFLDFCSHEDHMLQVGGCAVCLSGTDGVLGLETTWALSPLLALLSQHENSHRQSKNECGWVPIEFYLWIRRFEFHITLMCHKISSFVFWGFFGHLKMWKSHFQLLGQIWPPGYSLLSALKDSRASMVLNP